MRQDVEQVNDIERDGQYAGYPVPGGYSIIAMEDRTFTSIELSWEQATDTKTPQGSLEYRVYRSLVNNLRTVGEIDAYAESLHLAMDWTPATGTVLVRALAPGTRYYFNVVVRDESGNRSAYMPTRSTTLPADLVFLFSTDEVAGDLVSDLVTPVPGSPRARADALCRLVKSENYSEMPCGEVHIRAFISIDEADEIADMPANYAVPTDRAIRGPSGKKADQVARNWDDLFDGDGLTQTLVKTGISSGGWWSGSNPSGHLDSADNCNGWTDATNGAQGRTGKKNKTDTDWITYDNPKCNKTHRVVCACW
jgi:hypothetical protein